MGLGYSDGFWAWLWFFLGPPPPPPPPEPFFLDDGGEVAPIVMAVRPAPMAKFCPEMDVVPLGFETVAEAIECIAVEDGGDISPG